MTDNHQGQPIEMRVLVRGIEPSERFTAALDELGAAAAEMLAGAEDDEVTGFAERIPGSPAGLLDYDWIATVKPRVREYVYTPEFKK